jgi:predicted DNA-binding antitoxin AbrB/MazE fold protein
METIRAIFEDGVFRPLVPVQLPEHAQFEFEPRAVTSADNGSVPKEITWSEEGLDKIYEILDRRYNSGFTDTAERHNEHQP